MALLQWYLFGSSLSSKKNVKVGPLWTKLSGSAHVIQDILTLHMHSGAVTNIDVINSDVH